MRTAAPIFLDCGSALREANHMRTHPFARALALTVPLAFTVMGCHNPSGESSSRTRAPSFPALESYNYVVRAGDAVYNSKSVRFQGDWVVLETMRAPGGDKVEQREVWVPRSSVRFIEKVVVP
jgi:hypothetical protein